MRYSYRTRGTWDMGRPEKIDSRQFYEAGFPEFSLQCQKKVLMVEEQLFSTTNRNLFITSQKTS